MANPPLVSIGVPVYNGDNYLEQTLDCLLGQTYADFDLIISDNASTDGTRDICEGYRARDSRIQYHRSDENIGAGPNHNRVLELSTTPYFKWAAHDDLYDPRYLEQCVAVLEADPDVLLVHSDNVLIDGSGNPLPFDPVTNLYTDTNTGQKFVHERIDVATSDVPSERFHDVLHKLIWCTDMYGLMRRTFIDRTSLHESYYGSDKVFLAELALMGKFHHVEEVLFMKRCHSEMGAYMDANSRAAFMGKHSGSSSPYIKLFKGYTRAALCVGSLNLAERARCILSVAQKTVMARYWRTSQQV